MAIKADFHLHSYYSSDGKGDLEDMVMQGIKLGLTHMCFTEHMDIDYPPVEGPLPPGGFFLNTDSYLYDLIRCREKYAGQIQILFGVELGLQPHITKDLSEYVKAYDFDFVLGSSHICNRKDPYYASFYDGRSEYDAYCEYFLSIIENIKVFSDFDVYAHLDYIVRYGPNKNKNYSYEKYWDIFDEMLKLLIEKEKGIEINTNGYRNNLGAPNPCSDVIRRYRELGGEIITIGSDAHNPQDITADFDKARDILMDCGFRYYTVFEKRDARFLKL